MRTFSKIHLKSWRQFNSIEIELNRNMTILTGPNGCGKTTILNILSRHFGWSMNFTAPYYWGDKKRRKFYTDIDKNILSRLASPDELGNEKVGEIHYSDSTPCSLVRPQTDRAKYELQYLNQQQVNGLLIPSHQPPPGQTTVNKIPTDPIDTMQSFTKYQQLLLQMYGSPRLENPSTILKESLISVAMFGYGNQAVSSNPELVKTFEGFQRVVNELLPENLGFERIEIQPPDIILKTQSGDFSLDSMSGGVNALFGIAWQIHMRTTSDPDIVVMIDEPENHLHPSMQRTVIPSLKSAFPTAQFIVATHSPFVVSSDPEAAVYGLLYDDNRRINSKLLNLQEMSSSPHEVLREVLGVSSLMPTWMETSLDSLLANSRQIQDLDERAQFIYDGMERLNLLDEIPTLKEEGM